MAFQRRTQAVRRIGSAALDLCLVACGQMDGYWEMKIKPHDITGGIVIAREAGGVVTDFDGGDTMLETGRIAATNGLIHEEMLEVLGKTTDDRQQTTEADNRQQTTEVVATNRARAMVPLTRHSESPQVGVK